MATKRSFMEMLTSPEPPAAIRHTPAAVLHPNPSLPVTNLGFPLDFTAAVHPGAPQLPDELAKFGMETPLEIASRRMETSGFDKGEFVQLEHQPSGYAKFMNELNPQKLAKVAAELPKSEIHPSALTTPVGLQTNPLPNPQGLPIKIGRSLGTAAAIIQGRDLSDKLIHSATELAGAAPAPVSEVAKAGEDIYQAWMNPFLLPVAGLYSTYRLAKIPYNLVTGSSEAVRPYDVRPTLGNIQDINIPGVSTVAKVLDPVTLGASKLLSFLGL